MNIRSWFKRKPCVHMYRPQDVCYMAETPRCVKCGEPLEDDPIPPEYRLKAAEQVHNARRDT